MDCLSDLLVTYRAWRIAAFLLKALTGARFVAVSAWMIHASGT